MTSTRATMTTDERPWAFLVSTTPCARDIRRHLGSSAYSYSFVADALAPLLEQLGRCRRIDLPPSQLAHAAAQAEAEGFRPVQLAIQPLQDVYLTPAVPTIAFPFWEFPDLPDRSFGHDTRQDWTRIGRHADLILTACRFTAAAFRRAEVPTPLAVVPVPLEPAHFDLPDWDPSWTWSLTCRHEILGGSDATVGVGTPVLSDARPNGAAWRIARAGFRRIYPRLSPPTVEKLAKLKRGALALRGKSPARLAFHGARAAYKRHVRPWLSDEAIARITAAKARALGRVGVTPSRPIDPLLPSTTLTLSGLVFTTIFNIGDPRKNFVDALSAFLVAMADRPDATLVIKLVTNPEREHDEMNVLRHTYRALGLPHRCRVVAITEYLDEAQLDGLMRATTFYVNTSHAEGACLPLQRALAGGRPAIAPAHTAMADYLDDAVSLIIRAHPEPAHWPHDPARGLTTIRYRPVWSDIVDAFHRAAELADADRPAYDAMASAARHRMAEHAGRDVVATALRRALERLDDTPALARAS